MSNDQQSLAQRTATTDRFRLAAEQLASEKINVRLSGIYLLEQLAKDSPGDHPTVFALLSSFLRTHAHNAACARYFTDVPGVEPPGFDPAAPERPYLPMSNGPDSYLAARHHTRRPGKCTESGPGLLARGMGLQEAGRVRSTRLTVSQPHHQLRAQKGLHEQ